MTILAIYASGAVFFLLQAYVCAKITRERIIGALTWPMLLLVLPHIIRMTIIGYRRMDASLEQDERMAISSIRIGDRWGIRG